MKLQGFTRADRQAFSRACELMGGLPENTLVGRLGKNLAGEPLRLDPDGLAEAGRRELAWFSGGDSWIGGLQKSRLFDRQGSSALRSLRTVLFYPGLGELDLVHRAGLHRLARALCDLGQEEFEQQSVQLPQIWKECLQAVCGQVDQPSPRESAADLREELNIHAGGDQP